MTKLVAAIIIIVLGSGCDDTKYTLPLQEGDYAGSFSMRIQDGTVFTGGVAFSFHDFA